DTISFAVTGTITLNALGELPVLNSNISIVGPGANLLTVNRDSGAAPFRIFTVNFGKTVSISRLTLSGGSITDLGGGIDNFGALTLSNCTISGNSASQGGGIANHNGSASNTLAIIDTTLSGNSATSAGGGLVINGGMVTLSNCTLTGNEAVGGGASGGGIYNDGTLTRQNRRPDGQP